MIILEEIAKAKKAATIVDNSVFLSSHDDTFALTELHGSFTNCWFLQWICLFAWKILPEHFVCIWFCIWNIVT